MKFQISIFYVLYLLFAIMAVHANCQIIPSLRTTDWTNAGADIDWSSYESNIVNVMDFGAAGNGLQDDAPAILAAIASLGSNKGIIYFPAGTFLVNQPLVVSDSVILKGSGSTSTKITGNTGENNHIISISGTTSGSFMPIISGYQKDSRQITIALSDVFQKGDCAEIIEDGNLVMYSDWAYNCLGQIVIIDSVSENTLFLKEPLRLNFQSEKSPRIQKVNPRSGCGISCMKIERTDMTTNQTSNIAFQYAYNCIIEGVESFMCNFAHIVIEKSTNISIKNSYFSYGHDYGSGGKSYGVCIQNTSGSCLVENNIFKNLRHSMILQSGANGNVFVYNYSTMPFWTEGSLPSNSSGDIVLHGNYPYLNLFEGNILQTIVIDDSHGKNGPFNTFFRNRAELYGIFMNFNPATDSVNFVGNEITNTDTANFLGLYYLNGIGHLQYGNNIRGTITPAGTTQLADVSYYYNEVPDYWNISDNFPPVGIPSDIDTYINPAALRYINNLPLALCPDSNTTEISDENKIFPAFISLIYNPIQEELQVEINNSSLSLFVISVFDATGKTILHKDYKLQGGKQYLRFPISSPSTGVYLINMTGDRFSLTKKILIK